MKARENTLMSKFRGFLNYKYIYVFFKKNPKFKTAHI